MAKIELKFIDFAESKDYIQVSASEEYCDVQEKDVGVIRIDGVYDSEEFIIVLDVSTSIKFAKTLRTEINKIKS